MFTVIWKAGSDDLKDAYEIRKKVFIEEQSVPKEIERDKLDIRSAHVLIYNDELPVATGRIVFKEHSNCSLGRIAVLKEYRGKNIGKMLVENLVEKSFELGADEIHIHAQKHAERFYEMLNFTPYGELFYEGGIPHVSMILRR
ncbi:GNAT family N-acetyltransferase [Clostridium peptidivorans]|uniref:GNAT family N-acetyltransferase n=1 Tax=Clostridium peptidivorans TaxID=100174 RepID=UPI001A9A2F5C|nr:GNAT family N-acetyltransferase [Clostridium peptidivorans]